MEDGRLVIDHTKNIAVSTETHHNNLRVLSSLDVGMFHLAEFARRRETENWQRFGKDKVTFFSDFGSSAELLLGCIFDWFSISLVSYMRTVQLMHLMETNGWELDDLKLKPAQRELHNACDVYIAEIAPDVLEWRNKIAAHRAATDPRSDSLALLTYSTFPTVGYESPYYVAGHLRLTLGDGSSAALPQWSITQRYEELVSRYWPNRKLTELDWRVPLCQIHEWGSNHGESPAHRKYRLATRQGGVGLSEKGPLKLWKWT